MQRGHLRVGVQRQNQTPTESPPRIVAQTM
jgi:hypothetical protein